MVGAFFMESFLVLYFKRFWDEPSGGEKDDWGTSWWYLEMDSSGDTHRVIRQYSNGVVLKYDNEHVFDQHGELPDGGADLEEFTGYEIPAEEFESAWDLPSLNYPTTPNPRKPGALKGKISIQDDFDQLPPDIAGALE